jgi:DNA-binding SARP family transcriptional activator/tetratricopeptide (TPR) repeat protein
MLEIRFFGQPRFVRDGASFRLAVPPKALSILAYLLLHRGTRISRDTLSFAVWPDEDEDEARARLRKYLYRLAKALPAESDSILADGGTLRWNESCALWFDVWEFEDALSTKRYDEAVSLYEGDLLEGLYDEWLPELRERYRSRFFAALDDRLLAARRDRDLASALAYAQRILAADPWREEVVRSLMSIKYESGDRAGALQIFDEFARRAREEMDVAPMSDTVALRDAILRGSVPMESEERDERRSADRGFALVGRDDELQRLRHAWERAARGRGSAAIVSGEPGIGKSRLTRELVLIAQSEGARVLWGGTSAEESRPYQAIAETLEQAIAHLADVTLEPLWLAVLAGLVPGLHDVLEVSAPPPIAPEREQHRLIEAMTRTIQAVARARPTVLVLEDLQWASNATSLAVERIVTNAAQSPLLVILTHREDGIATTPFGRIRARLGAGNNLQVLPLGPLRRAAVASLVRAAHDDPVSDEIVAEIERAADGNPLFILSSLLAGTHGGTESTQATFFKRFEALSGETRRVAEYAAVAGSRFGFDLLREAAACSERDAFAALDELQDARIVEERPVAGAYEFRFTHELLRDSLYERVEERTRRRRHGRIARVLERLYPSDASTAGEIAAHWDRAGDRTRAAPHFVRAAEHAASVFAHAEAVAFARRALESNELDAREKRQVLWVLVESSWRLGELDAVREALGELEQASSAEERCRILYRRSELEFAAGDRASRLKAIEQLRKLATQHKLPIWLTRASVERIHSDLYAGVEGALQAAQEELERLDAIADPQAVVRLLSVCCTAAAADLAGDAARAYAARATTIAEASGDPLLRAIALRSALSVAHHQQDYARIRGLAEETVALARSTGDTLTEAIGYAYLANASYGLGDVRATAAAYSEALSRLERAGDRANLMRATLNCAVFECEEGFLERSAEHAVAAQRIARSASDRSIEHHATLVLATIEIERGQFAAAREILDTLLTEEDLDPQTKTGVLEESGRAALGLKNYAKAIADLESALAGFLELGQRWYARRTRAELALASALAGRAEQARSLRDVLRHESVENQPAVFAKCVERSLVRCEEALRTA